jgi:UDP-N-acetylmuramoyl-tripeptide--D-alanyl-D-alanine ligase
VSYGGDKVRVVVPGVVGRAHAYAVLAAIATAVRLGSTLAEAAEGIGAYEPPPGRMRLVHGMNSSMLIDDSYNASPVATGEALEALSNVPHRGRRIAVLADMLELGAFSVAEHKKIGAVAEKSADFLIAVGIRGRGIAEGAREAGMPPEAIHECEKGPDATEYLKSILQSGDVVLIKGSQSMRMEKVVRALMANPDEAKKLLCRQDEEWLQR